MPINLTLQRVDDDLAQGRILPAIQRLRSLVRTYPHRLDVRSLLADVYRSQGELVQAGRWSFVAEDADPAELAAFERAFRSARGRLAAVAWPGDDDTLGPVAAARLAALRAAAQDAGDDGRTGDFEKPDVGARVGCAVAVAVGALVLLSLATCVVLGVRVIVGWF
ncbi:DUF6584 family protein [Isoptericola sp. NPDC057191]|uniref:DUF6584 family protein n=1 Tax=Isoptericola sp. NPDC057191 TaxID=3346041 RepID=UPI0036334A6C